MTERIDALIDAANTVMAATRATPTMSAAAVRAVRLGLRMAFCRASAPGHAAEPCDRRTEHTGDRPSDEWAERRRCDEEQHGAEAEDRELCR